jgi:membrane-associated protein
MFDVTGLLEGAGVLTGLLIIAGIVFAESGLLIGFFLPGDTLLFTAGFFAAQGKLPIVLVLLSIFAAAVIGDNVGYSIGRRMGPRLFKKKDGILFRQEYITRAQAFYEKHGGKTIILARFVPVVRTFAPLVAGVSRMPRKQFVFFNIVGAFVWTVGLVMLGYFLGNLVDPHTVEKYVILAIGGAMAITVGPAAYHIIRELVREPLARRAVTNKFRRLVGLKVIK